MRNFVLQNFPFLENDFDAMTDYELFCKMVEYMRNAVNQLSAYDSKFIEFNNRLTALENYIETLDIQEYVNEKLDEMYELLSKLEKSYKANEISFEFIFARISRAFSLTSPLTVAVPACRSTVAVTPSMV